MKHKNKGKLFTPVFLFVITCSPSARSQLGNNLKKDKLPVISTISAYKNSIKHDNNKRMVLLKKFLNPTITDYIYSTNRNFTHRVLYTNPAPYVRVPVAVALQKVQEDLKTKGLRLKFFDAYRPYSVTKEMWKIVPDERYAANPAKGSGHNRGIAVDVTLIEISSGQELAMPTRFDDFTEKAHHSYTNLPEDVLRNRGILKTTMEKNGFQALSTEWWHYSLADTATDYELLDLSFNQLKKLESGQ